MDKGKIVSLEDRIPKLKQQRRKKANKRLITLLFLFFLLIGCIIYFQSPLSRIKNITVKGNEMYSSKDVATLSGLSKETNIWKIDKQSISEKLQSLPEIKSIQVQVRFPNSVNIQVVEHKRIAYLAKDGKFMVVLENGEIIEKTKAEIIPVSAPILIGFSNGEVLDEMVIGLEQLPDEIVNSISEIHHTPKETDEFSITLFMNDGFEVLATLRTFPEKMKHYPSIISQLDQHEKGIIDLEVGSFFKAYELEGADKLKMKVKVKGKHLILSLVCLVLGFMIAFSYQITKSESKQLDITDKQWLRNVNLRNQLIEQEEKNRELQKELVEKQKKVLEIEKELSKEAQVFFNLAEDTEKYRMYIGKVKVKGKGVEVTLADGDYNPNEENVNNYIVHEHHVFKVINELYISGASAVAVNGQRLSHNSYIYCNGPVITIDGFQHPAPFVITAIGEADVLLSALNLTGGIKDQLVNDNITVTIAKKDSVILNPILGN